MAREQPKIESRNRLLATLPASLEQSLTHSSEHIHLSVGETLYEANRPIRHIYFPIDGVVSMIATTDNGLEIEVATTGNEGMLGLPVFLGSARTPLKAFSQIAGNCLRIRTAEFRRHLRNEPQLVAILHRYAQALMMQISQSMACNRAHAIEQRCCRWLLMTQDRVNQPTFALTQRFLGQMLGVRRTSVGEVAGALQDAKLIRYSRGSISILNRPGLEKRVCGCYLIIRDEYNRLLDGARYE